MRPRRQRGRVFPWSVLAHIQRGDVTMPAMLEVWGRDIDDARVEVRKLLNRSYPHHTLTDLQHQAPSTFVATLMKG